MSDQRDDEPDCPDCGLPHPSTNPYCFCRRPLDQLLADSLRMRERMRPRTDGTIPAVVERE